MSSTLLKVTEEQTKKRLEKPLIAKRLLTLQVVVLLESDSPLCFVFFESLYFTHHCDRHEDKT